MRLKHAKQHFEIVSLWRHREVTGRLLYFSVVTTTIDQGQQQRRESAKSATRFGADSRGANCYPRYPLKLLQTFTVVIPN